MTPPPLLRITGLGHPAVDDRGVRVRFVKPHTIRNLYELGTRRRFAINERFTSAIKAARPERYIGPLRWSVFFSLCVLLMVAIFILLAIYGPFPRGTVLLMGLIALISAIVFQSMHHTKGTEFLIAMTGLSEGRCPSCAFSLEGLSPEPDGCILCPECGHAWNADRIVRPHWEQADDSVPRAREPRLDFRKSSLLLLCSRFTPDDCGRLVRVHNTRLWCVAPETRTLHDPQDLDEVVSMLRRLGRVRRIVFFVIGITLSALATVYWVIPAFEQTIAGAIVLGLVFGCLVLASVLVLLGSAWANSMKMTRVHTDRGWCGSCLNDLTTTPANRSGMRVCALCKSSWLDDRFPQQESDAGDSISETPPAP